MKTDNRGQTTVLSFGAQRSRGLAPISSLGEAAHAGLLVVVHTYLEVGTAEIEIRIISARRPDKHERRDYEGG